MSLEREILERIRRDFPSSEYDSVVELLDSYSGPERPRVIRDILELSKGSLQELTRYCLAARTDYRDVLYWAEYYADDPLLRGRDPRRVLDGIIEKWGDGTGKKDGVAG
jgi:hypothetical protein